jgi:agmatine deiminase
MIADSETNKLYLSSILQDQYPDFFNRFKSLLKDNNIPFELLQNTKDIWAKDYMPIQVNKTEFVRFKYDPDYLKPKKYVHLKTDSKLVCDTIGLKYTESSINLDGGNVVKTNKRAILCDKVFIENPHLSGVELEKQLIKLFQIEQLIFVPWEGEKYDYTGHSDGMVRFIDNNTVLINEHHMDYLKKPLSDAKLEMVLLPCDNGKDYESAIGYYINFLQMEQALIVPTFKWKDPSAALKTLEEAFPSKKILTIESDEIAREGGVLNCIGWNI